MEKFLSQSAKYIYKNHSDDLQNICLVFPNRRAGVFFTSYLQREINDSVIGPKVTTINELISGNSGLHPAERLQLISILYSIFKKHTQTKETFDEFYFWGEILLTDFNDIDRYLVNAKDLFANVSDIKEIESIFDYLTPEQKKALEQFWGSVVLKDKKEFEKKYLNIWEKLFPIYAEFKEVLMADNLAYGGMIDRLVVENLDKYEFDFKKYYIIGLNALNNCEKKIFSYLKELKKVEFLWDYDQFYLKDNKNEAGHFLRVNLLNFPPPKDFYLNTNLFAQDKKVKLVSVSSVYGQSQQIPNFIDEIKQDYKIEFDNTAIVLADESLLFSALGAIPKSIEKVNVTMGYPVKNSVVFGFLTLLVNLLKNIKTNDESVSFAYYRYVTDVLNHQLLANVEPIKANEFTNEIKRKNRITISLSELDFSPLHNLIFSVPNNVNDYSDYFLNVIGAVYQKVKSAEKKDNMLLEIIYSIYQTIEKLKTVVTNVRKEQKQEITKAVYFRLFTQFLGQVSVAFQGEPLSGMQVMGILETRCLDFENLIILGLNENKWPRTFTAPSFIPFNIRKGFGLPGIDEQDAMYAYYFYRLIQRSKNITVTYSVVKEGIGTGELSRYGYQLQYDSNHIPELLNLDYLFANDPVRPIIINSSKQIVEKLLSRNTSSHPLSPSAINTYLLCSLRFYFRYVVDLPEPDEVKEEIDGMIFGNIFHDTIETLYRPLIGKVVNKSDLEIIQKNKVAIANEISKEIAIHYFKEKEPIQKRVKLEGKTLLIYENVKTYLAQLINVDKSIAPFSLISLEKKYQTTVEVEIKGKKTEIIIGGIIDRVDRIGFEIRVVDYKTGYVKNMSVSSTDVLFNRDEAEPRKEILQALIYSLIYSENSGESNIQPAIYALRKLFEENFSPYIKLDKNLFIFSEAVEDFKSLLLELIAGIFSEENTFKQTQHEKKCEYCPYNKICRRF